MMRREQDQHSRVLCELSALVSNLLRWPPMLPESPSRRSPAPAQITPAGFASLLLGISVALMLCGSVTFFIGFMLMPWVLGLVMVFYVAGIVSSLSVIGRAILCFASPRKDLPVSHVKDLGCKPLRYFNFTYDPPLVISLLITTAVLELAIPILLID
ncbi:hypothetical protein RJT34_03735 [Clitoria ternatea]|uniref:Uncharacterized protein n=1 Tax=Clitoria ternatea TaxID=43366 RepID=A0AAN9Q1J0_CLITE